MWFGLAGLCAAVLSLAGIYLYLDPQVPKAETYRHVKLETPLRVYTVDEKLIAEFGERRLIPVRLEEVPQAFISALLDTEDKRFYEHSGIDFISLTNDTFGLIGNLLTGDGLGAGASTITMQLARNISFSLERRFLRKFKEMLLAIKIEQELSKDEILELYINVVPFGKRAYGAQAAALTYYGKTLQELSLPQLAMLAGIPQAPTAGNPINGPERSLRRRNVVLRRMLDQGSIDQLLYDAAVAAPITATLHARELDVPAPYPAEWVRQSLVGRLDDLYSGGYEVFTTLDSRQQRAATEALRRGLLSYDRGHGYRGPEARLEITEDEPLDDDRIRDTLRSLPSRSDLQAAVVTSVSETEAIAVLGNATNAQLDLESVSWARPFIDVDTRGPRIRLVSDVLSVGDVIRVQDLGEQPVGPEADAQDGADEADSAADATPATRRAWRVAQLPEIQGALVSLDPRTGAVRAMVGGFDFGMNQYNHALQAARQPGSGFKPFVYSAALDAGITPASIFMDAPLVFDDENLESQYRPNNDNSRYNGPTRLRQALYSSINLVSIRVLLEIGAGSVLDYAPSCGFSTRTFPRNTQLAIGGGTMAVTPVDMARAYAVIANGGYLVDPFVVDHVQNYEGDVVFRSNHPRVCRECDLEEPAPATSDAGITDPNAEPATLEALLAASTEPEAEPEPLSELSADTATESDPADLYPTSPDPTDEDPNPWDELTPMDAPRAIDERNAYIMHSMLQDVIKRGTGRRARVLKRGDLAGKTGTTNDAADTWFNGYATGLATTVWVGFSNHDPLGATAYGSNTPLPIWIDVMRAALKDVPEDTRTQPPGVVTVKIDPQSGEPAAPGNASAIFEYFLREHAPLARTASQPAQQPKDKEINAIDLF